MSNFFKYAIDIAVFAALYFKFFWAKRTTTPRSAFIVNTLMYIYLCMVVAVTLMPIIANLPFVFSHSYRIMDFNPFNDYLLERGDSLRQIVLNVFMFVPFGFLLPLARQKTGFWRTVSYALCLTLSIEIIQPFIDASRASDITDVITNTSGAMVGFLIYFVLKKPAKALLKRIN